MNLPSILLISYHFYPSIEVGAKRVTALARYLADAGFQVLVVSEFGGESYVPGTEISPRVVAIPVAQPPPVLVHKFVGLKRQLVNANNVNSESEATQLSSTLPSRSGLLARLRDFFFTVVNFVDGYKRWSLRAAHASVIAGKRYDVRLVLSSGPPHSVLLAGMRAAGKLKLPHIVDLRDPWAEQLAYHLDQVTLPLKLVRILERRVIRSSAAITSTGATVGQLLCARYRDLDRKINIIRNGFDGEIVRRSHETGGKLSILFAGELYAGRDPFPVLRALDALLSEPAVDASRITMTFMGRCATYAGQSLAQWLRGKRCEGVVRFFGQVTSEVVTQATQESTVLLNLAQQQPLSVPAKTFEHLASGKEILLVSESESETAVLLDGITGVNQVDPKEPGALNAILRDLYQRHVVEGRLSAPRVNEVLSFSRNSANEKFLSVMRLVAKLDY